MRATERDDRTIRDAIEVLTYGAPQTERARAVRTYADGRVSWDPTRRELYSYGRHFPLARYVPRDGRRPPVWIINGDSGRGGGGGWRISRTPDHQDSTRRAIAATGVDALVLPFSALDGAGIVLDSIRPVTVRADHEWTETVVVDTLEDVPEWRRNREIGDASWSYIETRQGTYAWNVTHHRLGDSVFSAVRETTRRRRPRPGETALAIADSFRDRELCAQNPYAPGDGSGAFHIADETGRACVHCSRELAPIAETRATRARYVSSFDYQESPPLYFLAQLPRGAAVDTVDAAIESLAPRAVHAARARGRAVYRQGDVFFIETDLTRAELEARGAVFARLTQWTRDARPRRGEAGYAPPLDAAGRRREKRYRARLWRETFRGAVLKATNGGTLGAQPETSRGTRAKWKTARAEHAAAIAAARAELRRLTLAGPRRRAYRQWSGETQRTADRRAHRAEVKLARERLDALEARGPRLYDAWNREGYTSRAHHRDFYRRLYGTNARAAWIRAHGIAKERYRPAEVESTEQHRRRRAAARAVLAIYGTAHGATETARVPGGGFYACGTVRHVPDLEPGRDGARDHAPLELDAGRWFLAVRNTVPRQS